jgi:guanylate kinase
MSSESTQRGDLWVIAAPSGAGKTSLVAALLKQNSQFGAFRFPYHPQPETG